MEPMDDQKSFIPERQKEELTSFTIDQCWEAIELLQGRIKHLTNADYKSYRQKEIKDLGLSVRPHNALVAAKITTVGELLDYGFEKIAALRNMGLKSVKEVREAVERNKPT
jgi:DNA-directed RNA polymerase alpha subunit